MATTGALNSFARLEAAVSTACMAHTSNASATWWYRGMDKSAPVPGIRLIFDREASPGFADGSVVDAQPVASVLAEDAPGIARKCALRITRDFGDTTPRLYTVLRAEPDGTGWVQLHLSEDAP